MGHRPSLLPSPNGSNSTCTIVQYMCLEMEKEEGPFAQEMAIKSGKIAPPDKTRALNKMSLSLSLSFEDWGERERAH